LGGKWCCSLGAEFKGWLNSGKINVLNKMYYCPISTLSLPKEVEENSINMIFKVHNFSIWRPLGKTERSVTWAVFNWYIPL